MPACSDFPWGTKTFILGGISSVTFSSIGSHVAAWSVMAFGCSLRRAHPVGRRSLGSQPPSPTWVTQTDSVVLRALGSTPGWGSVCTSESPSGGSCHSALCEFRQLRDGAAAGSGLCEATAGVGLDRVKSLNQPNGSQGC